MGIIKMPKNYLFKGCSKMLGCKARTIIRNEVCFFVRRRSAPQQTGVFQQPLVLCAQHFHILIKACILISWSAVMSTCDKLPGPGMPLNVLMQGFADRIKIHHLNAPGPNCAHNRQNPLFLTNLNNTSGYNLLHKNPSG
jgi:hypothetical protein